MRRMLLIWMIFVVSMSGTSFAFAEDWKEFTSKADMFSANFPGEPVVTETAWKSEYGAFLPSHVYTVKQGPASYSVTVVDYNFAKDQLIENAKRCPPGLERCDGRTSYSGEGYWKNDVRGAIVYATSKLLQRDVKLTGLMWNFQQMVQGQELQVINNVDQSRTWAAIYMHENKLLIAEATVPRGYPPPTLFTQSLAWLDRRGNGIRYATIYINAPDVPKPPGR